MCIQALLAPLFAGGAAAGAGAAGIASSAAGIAAANPFLMFAPAGAIGAAAAPTAFAGLAPGAAIGMMGTGMQALSGALGAVGQFANSRAQAAAAEASARRAERSARQSIEAGDQESDLARRRGAALIARNTVAQAANGMDVTGAHALDILEDSKQGIEQDAFRIRTNARREAEALSGQAANFRAEAASARSSAIFQPLQTILTTGARVGQRYASWYAGQRYPGTSSTIMAGGY